MFCPVCRARIPEGRKICHFNCPYLLAAACDFGNPVVQNAIHFLKYRNVKGLAENFSEIISDYLLELNLDLSGFFITPVPLHKKRERLRGFNQARLIAESVSRKTGVPLENFLIKTKNNKQQAGLRDCEKRKENAKGCFAAINPKSIAGKNIVLVDDVFTSGATMDEAVKALKESGAKKIIALVIAKA